MSQTRDHLGLPWTVVVSPESDDRGRYFVAEVVEIPGVNGYGETDVDARADLYAALGDTIDAMLAQGERIPAPSRWTGQMVVRAIPARFEVATVPVIPGHRSGHPLTIFESHEGSVRTAQVGHAVPV